MSLPPFDLLQPVELEEALEAVDAGAVAVCGGTELVAAMAMGLLAPPTLVSVRRLPELGGCRLDGPVLVIGAAMTHRDVARSPLVAAAAPLLAEVAKTVGNVRVRATGTVGGNVAFGEPRSDVITALVALEAHILIRSGAGPRRLRVEEFFLGPYETDLQPGELVVALEVPVGTVGAAAYRKVALSERPLVGVAVVRLAATGWWRVVIGAVGPRPLVVEVSDLAEADAEALVSGIDVEGEPGVSEAYRRHLAVVTVRRACVAAAAGVGEANR